jgi:hypothetical protein
MGGLVVVWEGRKLCVRVCEGVGVGGCFIVGSGAEGGGGYVRVGCEGGLSFGRGEGGERHARFVGAAAAAAYFFWGVSNTGDPNPKTREKERERQPVCVCVCERERERETQGKPKRSKMFVVFCGVHGKDGGRGRWTNGGPNTWEEDEDCTAAYDIGRVGEGEGKRCMHACTTAAAARMRAIHLDGLGAIT